MQGEKVNILFEFKSGPWGGGNQFLLALKNYLIKINKYEEDPEKAKIILFNSFPDLKITKKILSLKMKKSPPIIIMRLDGPVFLVRGRDKHVDEEIYRFSENITDGIIFQSKWSRRENYKLGLKYAPFETVIMNAPDPLIFNKKGKIRFSAKRKARLIATSWSSNWNKGFETYKWLDENLDFKRYEMTFVGNSPIKFKNIRHLSPMKSKDLAKMLKKNDIYITASKKDPCSNSLIEAMRCGLPIIALRDGGHPEIVKKGGEMFDTSKEIPVLIKKITDNYKKYPREINLPSIEDVGKKYCQFVQQIYKKFKMGGYIPKKISKIDTIKLQFILLKTRMAEKINKRVNRL